METNFQDIPYDNSFPLANKGTQILVAVAVIVVVVDIALIPVTGGTSAVLLIA